MRLTAIDALAKHPAASALILDFDGVLSPIVDDPTTSTMPESTEATLRNLAGTLGLLAVISGRQVEFLEDRVRVPGVPLLGSYGMEQSWDGERQLDPEAKTWLHRVRAARQLLSAQLEFDQGIRLEEKSVSVAVHWRQAPDHDAAGRRVREVATRVAAETGLRLEPGKLVEELRPPIAMDKGTAVTRLLAQRTSGNLTTLAYVGDDLGDLPALQVVKDGGGYALVVDHGHETDQRLLDIADETFDGTDGFAAWLARLAEAVR